MFEHPILAFDTCGEVGTAALVDLENECNNGYMYQPDGAGRTNSLGSVVAGNR